MAIVYDERRPQARLSELLHSTWVLRYQDDATQKFLIVPSGCCELILNFGAPCVQIVADQRRRQLPITFLAEVDRYFHIELHPGTEMVGVRILPNAIRAFVYPELFMHETYGEYCLPPALVQSIHCDVFTAAPQVRVEALEAALLANLRYSQWKRTADGTVRSVIHNGATKGLPAAVSRRQMERTFFHNLGVSPTAFANVFRFRRALEALPDFSGRMAELAAEVGYSDQSHLIREFRRYTGQTPSEFASSAHPLATKRVKLY